MIAVSRSGRSFMSDSLMAFQPAIDEPSNMVPSSRKSSSTRFRSNVTCCILPRTSVKRTSTYLTSFSLISARISLAVAISIIPCDGLQDGDAQALDGRSAGFSGADTDDIRNLGHENLAVADAPRAGGGGDGFERGVQ